MKFVCMNPEKNDISEGNKRATTGRVRLQFRFNCCSQLDQEIHIDNRSKFSEAIFTKESPTLGRNLKKDIKLKLQFQNKTLWRSVVGYSFTSTLYQLPLYFVVLHFIILWDGRCMATSRQSLAKDFKAAIQKIAKSSNQTIKRG